MSTDETTVVLIVGGGLGGLALAQLLLQDSSFDIKVMVFERDANENAREQGYCIGLDKMGLDVLKQIRVVDDILSDDSDAAYGIDAFRFVSRYLKKWFEFPARDCRLIYRMDLRRALLTNIDIQWNKRFISYKIFDNGVEAYFEDGSIVRGTILIGCDGAKSLVRAQLLPDLQRNDLGIISVAGTTEKSEDLPTIRHLTTGGLVRIFGKQGHTLLLLLFRESWLWSLSWPDKEHKKETNISTTQIIDRARTYFDNNEIVRLIELSPPSTYLGPYRLFSMSPRRNNPFPNNSRVTLLGDAAHTMTTHAGKGANTTFADAFDLAQTLRHRTSLAIYEQKMFKRGFVAVRNSLRSTNMIHWTGWRAFLRDCIFLIIHCTLTLINLVSMPFGGWHKKRHD